MISAKKGPQMIALTSSNIHMHNSHAQPRTQCTDRAQTDTDTQTYGREQAELAHAHDIT